MPCYDGRENEPDYAAIRAACAACTKLQEAGLDIPAGALEWWIAHQRYDQEQGMRRVHGEA